MLSTSNAMAPSPWSRYQKVKTLGAGSFGTVYLCRVVDPDSDDYDDTVAIKTVALEAIGEREASLAMSEVAILRNLAHPNVLRFIDCFIDEDHTLCCVTEYVDGGDLAGVIRNAKKQKRVVDAFVVVDMVRQALEGLAFLHSQAVLHRDIKPANIYVTRSGTIKIGDFGVSKLVSDAAPTAVTFIGTPPYICPELFMGETYSFGADIWALGVTAYELFCLKLPFVASNVLALANVISEGTYDREALQSRAMGDAQRQELLSSCGEAYVLKSEGLSGLVSGLVQAMIVQDPFERPTAHQLLMDFYGVSSSVPDASVYFVDDDDYAMGATNNNAAAISHDNGTAVGFPVATSSTTSVGGAPLPSATGPTVVGSSGAPTSLGRTTHTQSPPRSARSSTQQHLGLSHATLAALSRSLDQRLTQEARDSGGNNADDDQVRVGDDDEDENSGDGASLRHEATSSASAAAAEPVGSKPPAAWSLRSSFVDPHELERALREKALVYHQKRHAKLRAQREAQQQQAAANAAVATTTTTTGRGTSPPPPGGGGGAAAPFFSRGYLRPFGVPSARPGSATSPQQPSFLSTHQQQADDATMAALVNDRQSMRTVRAIAQSLVASSSTSSSAARLLQDGSSNNLHRLPYDPPRVRFSDGEDNEDGGVGGRGGGDDDDDDAKAMPIPTTCTFLFAATSDVVPSPSFPALQLPVKKVRPGCSLKRLLKRLRTALRAARLKASSPAAAPLSQLLPPGDEADDKLATLPAADWQLSLLDADGDDVSFSTQKEWKRLLKAHSVASNDDGSVDGHHSGLTQAGTLQLRSVLRL